MPYHWFILLIILVITVGSLATMKYFGGEFLPEFREGHYYVHMSTVPGTSLEEELRLGKLVTEELQKIHGIRDVSQQAGRAEMGEDPVHIIAKSTLTSHLAQARKKKLSFKKCGSRFQKSPESVLKFYHI
jgi:Cu/Ag efflux pump CusA